MRRMIRRILGPWRWMRLREVRECRRLRNIERYERQRERRIIEAVCKLREAFDRLKCVEEARYEARLREIGFN